MFTGLVEAVGTVMKAERSEGGITFLIGSDLFDSSVSVDDSIAMDGVCQTVTEVRPGLVKVTAIEETLRKTTMGDWQEGRKVNLERAASLGDRLGGHIVQGHVDCTGILSRIEEEGTGKLLTFGFDPAFRKYVIPVGSICINGISLTVASVGGDSLTVAIIPHTWTVTNISALAPGSPVNLEFDMIGKYIVGMAEPYLKNILSSK